MRPREAFIVFSTKAGVRMPTARPTAPISRKTRTFIVSMPTNAKAAAGPSTRYLTLMLMNWRENASLKTSTLRW